MVFGRSKNTLINELDWKANPSLEKGNKTLEEMSLVIGYYDNYTITKSGNLIGLISVSGINLDLLSRVELEDLFADYNAFQIGRAHV